MSDISLLLTPISGLTNQVRVQGEYTDAVVGQYYATKVTEVVNVFQKITQSTEPALTSLTAADAAKVKDAIEDLLATMQSETLTVEDPPGTFTNIRALFTLDMVRNLDMLIRSFQAAGATVSNGTINLDLDVLTRWKDLSVMSASIQDLMNAMLNSAIGNRSLQAVLEAVYVKEANQLIEAKLGFLEEALKSAQDTQTLLAKIQNLHNKITIPGRGDLTFDYLLDNDEVRKHNSYVSEYLRKASAHFGAPIVPRVSSELVTYGNKYTTIPKIDHFVQLLTKINEVYIQPAVNQWNGAVDQFNTLRGSAVTAGISLDNLSSIDAAMITFNVRDEDLAGGDNDQVDPVETQYLQVRSLNWGNMQELYKQLTAAIAAYNANPTESGKTALQAKIDLYNNLVGENDLDTSGMNKGYNYALNHLRDYMDRSRERYTRYLVEFFETGDLHHDSDNPDFRIEKNLIDPNNNFSDDRDIDSIYRNLLKEFPEYKTALQTVLPDVLDGNSTDGALNVDYDDDVFQRHGYADEASAITFDTNNKIPDLNQLLVPDVWDADDTVHQQQFPHYLKRFGNVPGGTDTYNLSGYFFPGNDMTVVRGEGGPQELSVAERQFVPFKIGDAAYTGIGIMNPLIFTPITDQIKTELFFDRDQEGIAIKIPIGLTSAGLNAVRDLINLRADIIKQMTFLAQPEVTPATDRVDGDPGKPPLSTTLWGQLNIMLQDLNQYFASGDPNAVPPETVIPIELESADTAKLSGLVRWMLDNYDKSLTGNQSTALSGKIQEHIQFAIASAQTFNDSQKTKVKEFMFVFEEYYKSASAVLLKISQLIEKMAQQISR